MGLDHTVWAECPGTPSFVKAVQTHELSHVSLKTKTVPSWPQSLPWIFWILSKRIASWRVAPHRWPARARASGQFGSSLSRSGQSVCGCTFLCDRVALRPVESKTRTYHGRVGSAAHGRAAWRGGPGRFVRAGHKRPSCPRGHRRQLS